MQPKKPNLCRYLPSEKSIPRTSRLNFSQSGRVFSALILFAMTEYAIKVLVGDNADR